MATATDLASRPPLTVTEFLELASEEGWDEDVRIELLDGEIVWMNAIGSPHAGCVNRLTRLLMSRFAADLVVVSTQNPVLLSDFDMPQPDVAVLRPRADFYSSKHADPSDILLLIEVADTTLRMDLGRKARIYADRGVVEYWVVDVKNSAMYVHRDPLAGGYAVRDVLARGDSLASQFAPDVAIQVADILP